MCERTNENNKERMEPKTKVGEEYAGKTWCFERRRWGLRLGGMAKWAVFVGTLIAVQFCHVHMDRLLFCRTKTTQVTGVVSIRATHVMVNSLSPYDHALDVGRGVAQSLSPERVKELPSM
jgi:hypothetical protein